MRIDFFGVTSHWWSKKVGLKCVSWSPCTRRRSRTFDPPIAIKIGTGREQQIVFGGLCCINMINTVDGRISAPVDMVNIRYRLLYIPGGAGFQPSTVPSTVDVIRSRGHWFTEAILPETVSIETFFFKTTFSAIRQEFQPRNQQITSPRKLTYIFCLVLGKIFWNLRFLQYPLKTNIYLLISLLRKGPFFEKKSADRCVQALCSTSQTWCNLANALYLNHLKSFIPTKMAMKRDNKIYYCYTDGRIVRTQFLKIVAKSRLSS